MILSEDGLLGKRRFMEREVVKDVLNRLNEGGVAIVWWAGWLSLITMALILRAEPVERIHPILVVLLESR